MPKTLSGEIRDVQWFFMDVPSFAPKTFLEVLLYVYHLTPAGFVMSFHVAAVSEVETFSTVKRTSDVEAWRVDILWKKEKFEEKPWQNLSQCLLTRQFCPWFFSQGIHGSSKEPGRTRAAIDASHGRVGQHLWWVAWVFRSSLKLSQVFFLGLVPAFFRPCSKITGKFRLNMTWDLRWLKTKPNGKQIWMKSYEKPAISIKPSLSNCDNILTFGL